MSEEASIFNVVFANRMAVEVMVAKASLITNQAKRYLNVSGIRLYCLSIVQSSFQGRAREVSAEAVAELRDSTGSQMKAAVVISR